jgi:mannosyltransferase OCH1-like enzyme
MSKKNKQQIIPKLLHLIWIGEKENPYLKNIETYKKFNPDWQIKIWNNKNIPKVINKYTYDNMNTWAGRVDVLRLEILYKYGGVYVDMDSICLRSLNPLIINQTLIGAKGTYKKIANGFLGCTKEHPAFKEIVENLDSRNKELSKTEKNKKIGISIYAVAGTRYITPYLRKYKCLEYDKKLKAKERKVIITKASKYKNRAFIMQLNDNTWKSSPRIFLSEDFENDK